MLKLLQFQKGHKHQRHNHYLFRPSTFFPELNIPVTMNDSVECPGPSQNKVNDTNQQNYLLPNTYPDENKLLENKSDYELQLNLLKRVKIEKLNYNQEDYAFQHVGYKVTLLNKKQNVK